MFGVGTSPTLQYAAGPAGVEGGIGLGVVASVGEGVVGATVAVDAAVAVDTRLAVALASVAAGVGEMAEGAPPQAETMTTRTNAMRTTSSRTVSQGVLPPCEALLQR